MTETLRNLTNKIASDIHSAELGFAMLCGYLEGNESTTPLRKESQNALFIELEKYKDIKSMLINLNIKGSVRKRADGLLELRVWLDGKRTSIYGKTEEELQNKFSQLYNNRRKMHNTQPQPKRQTETLYNWLDKWVELYKTDNVKKNSLCAIKSCIKVHIKTNFENVSLNRFTPIQIEETLKKIGSSRMRKYTYQILNEAYKKALQLKLIKENPFALVDVPQHKEVKGTPLTREEQSNFVAALADCPYRIYFLFLLYSGCRRSEGLSARWDDVNFEKRTIFIRGTKTEGSRNYIPLFDNLAKVLNEVPETERNGLISPFPVHQVERTFKKLCPTHHLHDLRHTFATNCIEAGVELKAVQAWLRHSNISITADTYAHATDKYLMQEAEKVNKK